MENKCLIAVQGPTEFITAYISFLWFEKEIIKRKCTPVLLVYDTTVEERKEPLVFDVIRKLSSGREWMDIIFLNEREMKKLSLNRYSKCIAMLRKKLGGYDFNTIFVSRNFGSFGTPLILNAYPDALRIEYGDSFGMVGNEGILQVSLNEFLRSPLVTVKRFLKKLIFNHFPQRFEFDNSILIMPLDWKGDFNDQKLIVPCRNFVMESFENLSCKLTGLLEFCNQLLNGLNDHCNLYLLSNFSNSKFTSMENELCLYKEIIRETATPGSAIILKNHPRSSEALLNQLYKDLNAEYKVKIINVNAFSHYPIELWIPLIQRCSVYPIFSSSVISLKYLFSKRVFMTLNKEKIYKYINEDKYLATIQGEMMCAQAISSLETWDGKSFLWRGKS